MIPNECRLLDEEPLVGESSVVSVPLGSVPLSTMVWVPLTGPMCTRLLFKLVPSPMIESRKVVLPLSSQPQALYC